MRAPSNHTSPSSGASAPLIKIDERRLAGPVWADEPEHLVAGQREAHVVDRNEPLKALGQPARIEQRQDAAALIAGAP